MKTLKKLGRFFGVFIFSTFLFALLFSIALTQFTEYSNLKNFLVPILIQQIESQLTSDNLKNLYNLVFLNCREKDFTELVISQYRIEISCQDVKRYEYPRFSHLIANALFEKIYYKKYDCQFISCLQQGNLENILVVISSSANEFFKSSIIYATATIFIGFVLILAFTENWMSRLKLLGWSIIFANLPILLLPYLKSFLIPKNTDISIDLNALEIVGKIIDKIIEPIKYYSVAFIVVGFVLVFVGYAFSKDFKKRSK